MSLSNQEADALRRKLNDRSTSWEVGEIKVYADPNAVFEFMRYGWPEKTYNVYLDIGAVHMSVILAGRWERSTAGYVPAHLFELNGSNYVALTPMHDKPLVVVRLGCRHADPLSRKVGRYAYDYTCRDCGHKWCIDSGD